MRGLNQSVSSLLKRDLMMLTHMGPGFWDGVGINSWSPLACPWGSLQCEIAYPTVQEEMPQSCCYSSQMSLQNNR